MLDVGSSIEQASRSSKDDFAFGWNSTERFSIFFLVLTQGTYKRILLTVRKTESNTCTLLTVLTLACALTSVCVRVSLPVGVSGGSASVVAWPLCNAELRVAKRLSRPPFLLTVYASALIIQRVHRPRPWISPGGRGAARWMRGHYWQQEAATGLGRHQAMSVLPRGIHHSRPRPL